MLTIENGLVFETRVVGVGVATLQESVNPVVTVKIEETETKQVYSWTKFNPETEVWEHDPLNTDPIEIDGVEHPLIDGKVEIIKPELEIKIPLPTLEEMQAQTLLNTEYLVIMSELTNL